MKPLICIAIEVKIRELDGLLYLAAQCIRKGFPVLIGSRARMWKFFRNAAKDTQILYIAKEMSNLDEMRTENMHIFSLDEEGGNNYTLDGKTRPFIIPEIPKLEKIFVWGELYRTFFLNHGAKEEQIVVSGHPRFDLKKKEFNAFHKELEMSAEHNKDYILINSNWAMSHYIAGEERIRKLYRMLNRDESIVDEKIRKDKIVIARMIPLAKRLARTYPELDVIIRPHPVESPDHYADYFDEPNIRAIKEGNSQQWIMGAKAVIHRDCTTGLEAFIAQKPVISYLGEDVEDEETVPVIVSNTARDEDTVMELVQKAVENNGKCLFTAEERKAKEDILRKILANIDFDAAEKIAESLDEYTTEKDLPEGEIPTPRSFFYRKAKRLRRLLKGNNLKDLDMIVKNKFPGLTRKEVAARMEAFQKAVPSIPEASVMEYDIDTFIIAPKS